jgi:hypothetical protein
MERSVRADTVSVVNFLYLPETAKFFEQSHLLRFPEALASPRKA